jgi:serine/threonine protein kinase
VRAFGKYRLVEPLASGGMADVWRAEVAGAEGVVKEVALKLVRGEHAARSDFVRMFVQEARLAARLTHANVVQVFEFDQVDGRYYIAMELVRGRHLGQVTERARERGARLGLPRAVHVVAEVARGLAYAHRLAEGGRPLGLVHRDVSPHNVLLSFEGEVKLADFGIARAMNQGELTDPGTVKGKLAYMAPEQARGAAVDARADVFSLGVILWELCAGRRLFARDSDAATLAAVLADDPVSPPSAWNEDVPPELDAAVLGALERDPGRRTASAQELAATLAAVLLRVTRSPEEVDLRDLLHRLFPDEAARAASGAPAQEATVVRPVPVAREPVAEPSAAAASKPDERPGEGEESVTRTAARGRSSRTRAIAAAAVAVGLATAAGIALRAKTPTPTAISPSTPTPTPTATATPTPTAIPTAIPTATPAATPSEAERRGARDAATWRRGWIDAIGKLELPPAASGEGVLSVHTTSWARVFLHGEFVGNAPGEVRLPAGEHPVRVVRPNRTFYDRLAKVKAGERSRVNVPGDR